MRLDPSALETVFMIETDLALSPDDPAYDHDAFSGFIRVRSEPTSSTIPIMTGPKSFPFEAGRTLPIRCE